MRQKLLVIGVASAVMLYAVTSSSAPHEKTSDGKTSMKSDHFDITPFALPNTPPNEIWFEEPHDISGVVVAFDGAPPEQIELAYQRKCWPETQLEREAQKHPMGFGWVHQDDWFNGHWQTAAIQTSSEGDGRIEISFHNLAKEPGGKDFDFTYRRTYALRVTAQGNPRIVGVWTASPPAQTGLKVELDAGQKTPGTSIQLSGYNAIIESVNRRPGDLSVPLDENRPKQFQIAVRHMKPAHAYSGDDGHVKFELNGDAFTISLTSLEAQGPIWFAEMGIYISKSNDSTSFSEYQARCADSKTISQQVMERAEQSLAAAYHGQPRPHLSSFNLGCALARQRFGLESNGDIVLQKQNVTFPPDPSAERYKNDGDDAARFYFGLEKWRIVKRTPDPEPVMAYTLEAQKGGLSVEQQSLAVPLMTPILEEHWKSSDTMAALLRFRFRNNGAEPAVAQLPIRYSQDASRTGRGGNRDEYDIPRGPLDLLRVEGNTLRSAWKGEMVTRCAIETAMRIEEHGDEVTLTLPLAPGESCEAVLKIPFVALANQAEEKALSSLAFDQCHQDVTQYWRRVAGRGATLRTPEEPLNALHTAHPAYIMLSDYAEDNGSINTSVGTSTYGNFSNESCMIVHELDQRGLHEDAQRRLDLWIHYQSSVPQPGNFTDYDGMYFGAGGFESGAYNQHHGWVLWCLGEHFLLTRDTAWFQRVADSIVAGADWVFRQRKNTLTDLPHSRGWERGFLPAGSLEDVTDFYYWLSTNSLTWRGTEYAARALEAAGHPEAARVRSEADAYKADLHRGFETMRQHTPLVRLRDGRWVPDYPSRLYRRGRETGWIRETLEGSVYLLISGLYDAKSPQGQWILDDFQDNRYPSPPFGYAIPDFDMNWYDRGGISMQPNLLAGLLPHLDRDEPEIYLWMFYNAWNSCYREESNAMIEHPSPVLGWSNNVMVKTSDEANAINWLRYQFVYPHEDALYIGRAIPRAWFAQTQPFELKNVSTPFGEVSVSYEPNPKENKAKAVVELRQIQAPGQTTVRFRTPEKQPLRTVRIDGQPATAADPERGDVDITGRTGIITIEVEY